MNTRKLSLEQLEVESFETASAPVDRGTVEGQQASAPYVCRTYEYCGCNDGISDLSCMNTCYAAGSGCVGGTAQTCPQNNTCYGPATCDLEGTCGGCTAYHQAC
jgi:hypothetical protein